MAHSGYGAMPAQLEAGHGLYKPQVGHSLHKPHKRRQSLTGGAMCCMLFLPVSMFTVLYATVCFSIHYSIPILCWGVVLLGLLLALAIGFAAYQKAQENSGPRWLGFLFVSTLIAAIAAPLLGDINFWTNFQAYYDLKTLNQYQQIDPFTSKGEAMMDAGMIRFMDGSGLDLSKSIAFQNLDTYCAAPIINSSALTSNATVESYDFWAVGLNCCPRNTSKQVEFTCGAYHSKTARDGLRLMDESQRDYFRLTVQQAEAQFKIRAKHPLFFYWTEDAHADMEEYWTYGNKYYKMGVFAFFVFQVFLILLATALASKFEFE